MRMRFILTVATVLLITAVLALCHRNAANESIMTEDVSSVAEGRADLRDAKDRAGLKAHSEREQTASDSGTETDFRTINTGSVGERKRADAREQKLESPGQDSPTATGDHRAAGVGEHLIAQGLGLRGLVRRTGVTGTTSSSVNMDARQSQSVEGLASEPSPSSSDTATEPIGPGASPLVVGKQTGTLRNKLANGIDLSEAERAQLNGYAERIAEIEKSPGEFASFQTANIAAFMGWRNDPRQQDILRFLTDAKSESTGFDEVLDQKTAATIYGLLKDNQERQLFRRGFRSVLAIETARPQ